MSKDALLAGLTGRPSKYEFGGTTVWLRPLRHRDRVALRQWYAAHEHDPDVGVQFERKIAALVLTDEAGGVTLTEDETGDLDAVAVREVADEAARRAGLRAEEAADAGKGPSPATPS